MAQKSNLFHVKKTSFSEVSNHFFDVCGKFLSFIVLLFFSAFFPLVPFPFVKHFTQAHPPHNLN